MESSAMAELNDPVYLYILMRTDLTSMNAGKAVAQGTHAANQCVFEYRNVIEAYHRQIAAAADPSALPPFDDLLSAWEAETGKGFGTCITLGVNERQLRNKIWAARTFGLHANITHDPSYPLKDGDIVHLLPLDTCGYVFARKSLAAPLLFDLSLMP